MIRDFPLKILNKPDFEDWHRTLSNFIFFPFITYGWRGWVDTHLLVLGRRPLIRNCIVSFQNTTIDHETMLDVYETYKFISAVPAVSTRFLQSRTIIIQDHDVHLMVLSDTTKSVVVYAPYVFIMFKLFGSRKHLTYWIHPEYDTITITFKGRVRAILKGVGSELTYPSSEILEFWKRRGVLLARRIWEINIQTTMDMAALSPEFLFSSNTVPLPLLKGR